MIIQVISVILIKAIALENWGDDGVKALNDGVKELYIKGLEML